ncbi:MAG: hypothetical protein IJU86_03185 [Firmicutes bacterium]|nr:hypothetical protein [Bacillota bacterium]
MSTLHNFVSQENISAEEFIASLNKNLKSLRQSLLDETVLRTPLNYDQKKSAFIANLNSMFPNLSKEQQESVAIILNENGELNSLDTENLRLLDKDFLEKNKLLPNKLLNQIGEALGAISSYLGMIILAFSPLDSSLLVPGALLTGAGFTVKSVCVNKLEERRKIVNGYGTPENLPMDLGLNQDLDVVPEKITEKNNDVKINLSVEKADLGKDRHL